MKRVTKEEIKLEILVWTAACLGWYPEDIEIEGSQGLADEMVEMADRGLLEMPVEEMEKKCSEVLGATVAELKMLWAKKVAAQDEEGDELAVLGEIEREFYIEPI